MKLKFTARIRKEIKTNLAIFVLLFTYSYSTLLAQSPEVNGKAIIIPSQLNVPEQQTMSLQEFIINYSVTQYASDYRYVFSYSGVPTDICSCSQTITIRAAKNSYQSGNNWWSFTTGSSSGTYNRDIGPGMTAENRPCCSSILPSYVTRIILNR